MTLSQQKVERDSNSGMLVTIRKGYMWTPFQGVLVLKTPAVLLHQVKRW